MVKFHESNYSYDYSWPAVTLAYFLRYPNPFSTHVVSCDTLHSALDATGNLHTTRLLVKRGKLPRSVARFIPKIKESYILERSVVNTTTRTMTTEVRNLDWDGVLSVVENQVYASARDDEGATDVRTVVRFESKLGTARRQAAEEAAAEGKVRRGWLGGWGTSGVQRSIELVGRSRIRDGLAKSREGMKFVLERLGERGFVGVVVDQRQGGWERWRKVWRGEGLEEV